MVEDAFNAHPPPLNIKLYSSSAAYEVSEESSLFISYELRNQVYMYLYDQMHPLP